MSSPISAQTPIGPANASKPPPGYTANRVVPLVSPTELVKPVVALSLVTLKFSKPTLPVTKTWKGPDPV